MKTLRKNRIITIVSILTCVMILIIAFAITGFTSKKTLAATCNHEWKYESASTGHQKKCSKCGISYRESCKVTLRRYK